MWPTEAENYFLRIKSNSKAPFLSLIELSSFLEKRGGKKCDIRTVWHEGNKVIKGRSGAVFHS
jgi:hypothetical protein